MHAEKVGAYLSGPNYRGVSLGYENSTVSMVIILPNKGTTPEALLKAWKPAQWVSLVYSHDYAPVNLVVPRFVAHYKESLMEELKTIGFPQATVPRMGKEVGFISDVKHATRLEVDEVGTVAAAVTAVMMAKGAAPSRSVQNLTVDRPFIILIHDTLTQAVLFCGIIRSPDAS
jgi:serpin B